MQVSSIGPVVAATLGIFAASPCRLRGAALCELPSMYAPERKSLGHVVLESYAEYRGNALRWSGVYFTCVFGSAFLSAFAGLVLKLDSLSAHPNVRNDLAAGSAMIAALLITLSTVGEFQRKWQSNRLAASAMENLAFELAKKPSGTNGSEGVLPLNAVIEAIKAINAARNRGIVGEQLDSTKPVKTGSGEPSSGP